MDYCLRAAIELHGQPGWRIVGGDRPRAGPDGATVSLVGLPLKSDRVRGVGLEKVRNLNERGIW